MAYAVNDALQQTLSDLVDFLDGRALPFAVIGGIAVAVRGEPRFTADVDVVIGADVDSALVLLQDLGNTPFRPLFAGVQELVQTAFLLPLRHVRTTIKVDLAIGLSGFERQVIDRATTVDVAGRGVPIASAEDLILMKVLAARPRDLADVRGIVARQPDALDWEYLRRTGLELEQAVGIDILEHLRQLKEL
jgi:hypothetical protein